MSGFIEFSFDEGDEKITRKTKKFKAEANQTYRLSFAWWPENNDVPDLDAAKPRFGGGERVYIEGVGYVYTQKGADYSSFSNKEPSAAIATIVVVWPTNRNGEIDTAKLKEGEYEVVPWIFGKDKYNQIKSLHQECHLGSWDLKASCTDATFQKMTFTPAKDSMLRRLLSNDKTKKIAENIFSQVRDIAEGLKAEIGRDMTVAQIKDKLSGGSGSSGRSGGGRAAAVVDSAVTSDIDSLVDSVLDD